MPHCKGQVLRTQGLKKDPDRRNLQETLLRSNQSSSGDIWLEHKAAKFDQEG